MGVTCASGVGSGAAGLGDTATPGGDTAGAGACATGWPGGAGVGCEVIGSKRAPQPDSATAAAIVAHARAVADVLIRPWSRRRAAAAIGRDRVGCGYGPEVTSFARGPGLNDSLELIAAEARVCTRCRLAETRQHAAPGSGDPAATLLLVGEAPGAREDETGLPFQGMAGRFLDRCLAGMGLRRDRGIYIASVNKCRPPRNRAPKSDEIAACAPYLTRQIALLHPRVIFAMGATAALRLHPEPPRPVNVTALRGLPAPLGPESALIVSYHPAAAMRFPDRRQPFIDDLRAACELAGLRPTERTA